MDGGALLEIRNLKKHFRLGLNNKGRVLKAIDGVSLSIRPREILGIVGESGCGKSTLGRLAMGLIEPSGGEVLFNGQPVPLSRGKGEIQMVFQNPFASFNPKIRITGALMEVCRYYGFDRARAMGSIASLFDDTGLSRDLLDRWPHELSGGQLQRLAIARALLSDPGLLVADEPLSALDVSVQAQLLNLLGELRRRRGLAMLFISHDMSVVEFLSDRVAVMYLGHIVETAPTEELFTHTLHPYTRTLIAAAPKLEGRDDNHVSLKGETPDPSVAIEGCPFAPRCPNAEERCFRDVPVEKETAPGHIVSCHLV
ncbi:peptide ABC transporter ATP-binding protein [Spirochaetia bacterium]|nr:peptide ABC transporter ATP-binding protein [Spirochaetia bacterium]